jgi:hypothetical protein
MVFEVLFLVFCRGQRICCCRDVHGTHPAAEAEEKTSDLQRRLNESLKVVREKLEAASKWQQRAEDVVS